MSLAKIITIVATVIGALAICIPSVGWAYTASNTASEAKGIATENRVEIQRVERETDHRVDKISESMVRFETNQAHTQRLVEQIWDHISNDKKGTP